MITREEAAALLDELLYRDRIASHAQAVVLARTVVALYDERDALRAELDTFAAFHRGKTDALALDLRRLRAAEAPGTDDEAFEGTGWWFSLGRQAWVHKSGAAAGRRYGLTGWSTEAANAPFLFALDAMRAAVPGSV